MHTGDTERLPANVQIFAASIGFIIISYAVFRMMWNISIPALFLITILVLLISTVFLEARGVLTSATAFCVAVILPVAAYFAAVIFLFPSARITHFAAIAGGGVTALFVVTSTITSVRAGTLELEVPYAPQIETGEDEDLLESSEGKEPDQYCMDLKSYVEEQTEGDPLPDDPIDLSEGTEALIIAGVRDRDGLTARKPAGWRSEHVEKSLDLNDMTAAEKTRMEKPELPEGVMEPESASVQNPETPRYIIYERRTMRPLGEYFPEGERPRLDRLALYRMFPEYDHKTFQIDSIRWLEDEVGIFIKGEKKKN